MLHPVKFSDLGLIEPILKALKEEKYVHPTPIQAQAIPPIMEGRDVLGCAQTGTGKTAAFALPILHRLSGKENAAHRRIRALILSPTRELTSQIGVSFSTYGKHLNLRGMVIFGGVSQQRQEQVLKAGIDLLIATPGRLLDLVSQGIVDLKHVEVFVLDEADNMLDMGFINDIRKIIAKLPHVRQNLLFSATMPPEIRQLANTILKNPVTVSVTPVASTVELIEQSIYFVEKRNKPVLLTHFLSNNAVGRVLVFTRTKHGADKVARHLSKQGIRAEAIHGNKNMNARTRVLASFKGKNPPVLVATDIAARGLDIDEVSHVVNFDVPNVPETYVHRIGRTGRAGATGSAISFCDPEERSFVRAIEKLTKRPIAIVDNHPEYPKGEVIVHHHPHPAMGTRTAAQQHLHQPQARPHQAAHAQAHTAQPHAPRPHAAASSHPQPAHTRQHKPNGSPKDDGRRPHPAAHRGPQRGGRHSFARRGR